MRKLPVVTVSLVTDGGAVAEPAGQEGIARLTARALLEGTRSRTGDALTESLERLGASLDADADWDSGALTMTVLTSRLSDAMALVAEVVLEPAFPERELERLKAERLAEILQRRAEPRGLADDMFARFLYASNSRYSLPDGGSPASVSAIDRRSVMAFHADRYRAGSTTAIIVGDVGVDDALRVMRSRFGAWPAQRAAAVDADDRPARRTRAVHLVQKADAPQSELRIGHVGIPRVHPDYFAALVMNMLLGGLFSSRINLNLREAHGYTYGASSYFDWRRQAGPFVVASAVRSDVTAAAAREVLAEIDRMRAEKVTTEELSLATSYLEGVFPIRYETTAAIARALTAMVVYGLPPDYFDTYRDRVRAVSAPDVLRAAREFLHPEELQLVAVGDPAVIREPLDAMDLGPLQSYDTAGVGNQESGVRGDT
ncbi:MAG TPA: pitrilysin family protein [Gemmatimonadaceae bacterium]|nr:pitrilysin family protein [Gemmatimonadaceae bacterium]